MTRALVSVIIPAFNCGEYLIKAVESVLRQTYSPIELIVIDDGSTDDTRQTIEPLINCGAIRYVYQSNQGLSSARNAGIRLAKGKYLQFLDADDLLLPQKIHKQVKCLEAASTVGVAGCDFRFFDDIDHTARYGGDAFKGKFPVHTASKLFEFETVIHRWLFSASLFHVFGSFEENLPVREDWLVLWRLAANGVPFIYVDEPLALYRRHDNNMTCDFERMAGEHLFTIESVDRYQREQGLSLYSDRDLDALRESYHYELGLSHIRARRSASAWYHLLRALFLSPNRRQVKLLLTATIPVLGPNAMGWVTSANDRLWRWRAHLRKTLVG